jgi:hypothetical protein
MQWSTGRGSAIVSYEPSDEGVAYRRLSRLDSRIRNQFDLITSRTGWLLTSHAFLLGAMATTLNGMNGDPSVSRFLLRTAILLLLPLVGIISSLLVHKSIMAAYRIVEEVKKARDILLEWLYTHHGYECISSTAFPAEHFHWGDRPPKVFPQLLLGIWAVLFVLAIVAAFLEMVKIFAS